MCDVLCWRMVLVYVLLVFSLVGVVVFLLLFILVVVWLSLYWWDLLGLLCYVGLINWWLVLIDFGFVDLLVVIVVFVVIVVLV